MVIMLIRFYICCVLLLGLFRSPRHERDGECTHSIPTCSVLLDGPIVAHIELIVAAIQHSITNNLQANHLQKMMTQLP